MDHCLQVDQPGSAVSDGSSDTPAPSSLWQRGSQWLWASMSLDLGARPSSAKVGSAPAAYLSGRCRHSRIRSSTWGLHLQAAQRCPRHHQTCYASAGARAVEGGPGCG